MKLVIDIPEEVYKNLLNNYSFSSEEIPIIRLAIATGTPLPKGYGRLIDARAFETAMYHEAFETDSDMQRWDSGCWIRYKMFENVMCDAKTIIEADKD